MSRTVIIYGPQGSGKTSHAQQFRCAYHCSRVKDGWPVASNASLVQPGDLVLTNAPQARLVELLQAGAFPPGTRIVPVDSAHAKVRRLNAKRRARSEVQP